MEVNLGSRYDHVKNGQDFEKEDCIQDRTEVLTTDPCPLGLPKLLTVAHIFVESYIQSFAKPRFVGSFTFLLSSFEVYAFL